MKKIENLTLATHRRIVTNVRQLIASLSVLVELPKAAHQLRRAYRNVQLLQKRAVTATYHVTGLDTKLS